MNYNKLLRTEVNNIYLRYRHRNNLSCNLYHQLDPQYFYTRQERERFLLNLFRSFILHLKI